LLPAVVRRAPPSAGDTDIESYTQHWGARLTRF
jgi:hypothetical protein